MTSVVNVKVKYIRPQYQNLEEWCKDKNNVYIGRRGVVFIGKKGEKKKRYPTKDSIFANPFKVGKDGTREEVIEKYNLHIKEKLEIGEISKEQMQSLQGKNLGCWCAPQACHGNVLKELLDTPEYRT